MVIEGKQARDTKGFPRAGRVVFGLGSRGWKSAAGNGPPDMQWPFTQERDGGSWTGRYMSLRCLFKVCSTVASNFI